MAEVVLNNLVKVYESNNIAVNNVSLEIKDKEFVVLVGPSGCGKSTMLRMIAGLEEISSGQLQIDGTVMNEVQAKDRDIAMVFQSYALYPHMSIRQNIAFPLKMKGVKREVINEKVEEVSEILELNNLLDRKPAALSGGQRQRVALGRAMVRNPKVFLLDEPLSNLDAKLRVSMRSEIVKLHRKLETTFIYVTHDQTEAMTMGDRIAILRDGILEQMDTPTKIYDFPANKFVATFIGSPTMNLLEVSVVKDQNIPFVSIAGHKYRIHEESLKRLIALPKRLILGLRPEAFSIASIEDEDTIDIVISSIEQMGSDSYIFFEIAGVSMIARVAPNHTIKRGCSIKLKIDMSKAYYFNIDTEESLLHPIDEDMKRYS
ncbi:ABC transporter ATP-binding protein [Microaceticoccus formicicus]|uniref:ABC transporter ATP-binding protein n=1 Tax=Microaceticoccus formicicus TaxID=3118105 RepID=UPI003CD03902|nr:sn-glycerol-3-phosphate ABC transporter ATP-binding protein UgpC [Peptoniphilaceae bacterium AMB_02]